MLSAGEMKALVDEIVTLGNELRVVEDLDDTPARTRPAATAAALDAFTRRYGARLPPSYLQLLSIYDGIENFEWVDVSLLSIDYLMTNNDLDGDWVEAGVFAAGATFIFAESGSDAHVVAFLTRTAGADGEMEVVHRATEGTIGEHKNLEEYLLARRDWFASELADQRADREALDDD